MGVTFAHPTFNDNDRLRTNGWDKVPVDLFSQLFENMVRHKMIAVLAVCR
jgi:hypothetical protein